MFDDIVSKYSDPLPCETCPYALKPIGEFSRAKNCFCDKYPDMEHMKPHGILFNNEKCPHYDLDKKTAEDGGPGSGNFGHRGRPGKVGGSQKGGGKQYRGGRSDIGYFGSRRDWLNGLSGERQFKEARFIAEAKRNLNNGIEKKKKIESLGRRGLLTQEEVDERLKEEHLSSVREDMTPEQYVMQEGSTFDKIHLLEAMKEARSWSDTQHRLKSENLSEAEQRVLEYISDHNHGIENVSKEDVLNTMIALQAKAVGVDIPIEIPEEIAYQAKIKERPTSPGIDWYIPATERSGFNKVMENYMATVSDFEPPNGDIWLKNLSKSQFERLTHSFVDTLKYKDMSKSEINNARLAVSQMKSASGFDEDKDYGPYLTKEEKDVIQRAVEAFLPEKYHQDKITGKYLDEIQKWMSWMGLGKKQERRLAQDFLNVQTRLMTGISPNDEHNSEVYKKIKEKKEKDRKIKQEARKLAEEQRKRNAKNNEDEKKRREDGIKNNNPLHGYERDEKALNQEHLDDVVNGVNPNFDMSNRLNDDRYTSNCQRCVVAFVARLRGYKVEAKPLAVVRGGRDPYFINHGLKGMFVNASEEHVDGGTGDKQKEEIDRLVTEWGDGSVGLVSVAWANRNSAHVFVVMNVGGVVKYIDPQCPRKDASEYVKTGKIKTYYTNIIRADDKEFTHWVHDSVRPEGGNYGDNCYYSDGT